jgi:hypothetical protein
MGLAPALQVFISLREMWIDMIKRGIGVGRAIPP